MLTSLEGVEVDVPGPGSEAPEIAWGDAFATYDADGRGGAGFPFATVVTKDYPGFDESSDLDRDGVYRLNLWVGRDAITSRAVQGALPDALDTWIPHPVYAPQGWLSILSPGDDRAAEVAEVVRLAHADAVQRYRRR